jgi:hypothetical protein
MKTVALCFTSIALVALGSGCAPDSSVGPDTTSGSAGAAPINQGGSPGTSGAPSVATAGASGSTATAGAAGSVASVGGSGGSTGTAAGSGGTSGSGVVGGSGPGVGGGNAMGGGAGQGGPSLCPVAGTTLCDGFEGDAPGAGTSAWTVSVATGDTMAVDTTKFYRGSKSMKFSAKSSAYIVTSKIFTGTTKATNNAFWGRYFILSNVAAAATYSQSHVVFGALADAMNSGTQFHFVGGSRGKLQAEIRLTGDAYTDNMTMPAVGDPAFPLVADGWQCWEWQVTADDSFDFYINGTEVPEMKITAGKSVMSKMTFSPMPIFGGLYLGWQSFSVGSAISGWIDEVAIGPNRIGCGS